MTKQRTTRKSPRWVFPPAVVAAALVAGCAMGPAMTSEPVVGPVSPAERVADLERAQEREVARFEDVTAGDDRCERLCAHLDAICTIGGRICDLARDNPGLDNDAACLRARDRCDDATARLPPECSACLGE